MGSVRRSPALPYLFSALLSAIAVAGDAPPVDCITVVTHLYRPSKWSPFNHFKRVNAGASEISLNGASEVEERWRALAGYPVGEIMASPGHTFIEDAKRVSEAAKDASLLAELLKSEPIILNAVTGPAGQVLSVDAWVGHDGLAALLLAKKLTIGDLPRENVRILVNGHVDGGTQWGHWVRASGADLETIGKSYSRVSGPGVEEGTISVDGAALNFDLGSRTDLAGYLSTLERPQPKIAIQFGTLDPYHEGHFGMLATSLGSEGFDEALVVPGYTPAHKPNASPIFHRRNIIARRLDRELKANLFSSNSALWLDQFGVSVFVRRIQQTYGTTHVEILIGQDAFDAILKQGLVRPGMRERYRVFPRGNGPLPELPEALKDHVTYVRADDRLQLSSTLVKKQLAAGSLDAEKSLHPRVLEYIRQNHLYGTEKFLAPVGQEANPFFKAVASGKTELVVAQVGALDVLASASGLPADFRRLAEAKRATMIGVASPPPNAFGEGEGVVQWALEFALGTFISPHYDREFRPALIQAIGESANSGTSAIEALLPTVRGIQIADPQEIKQSVEAIAKIGERRGNYVPRGQNAVGGFADQVARLVRDSKPSVSKIGEGNANVTLLLTYPTGEKFVFKPRMGEKSFKDAGNLSPTYVHFAREAEAYSLVEFWAGNASARRTGRSRVRTAKTLEAVLTIDGKAWGPGSMQVFQEGYTTLKDFIAKRPEAWEKIRKSREWLEAEADVKAFDFVMGNVDRFPNRVYQNGNLGNILVPAEMTEPSELELVLIDNGVGRPGHPGFDVSTLSPHMSAALRQAFHDFDAASFRKMEAYWLSADGVEDVIRRVELTRDYLAKH